MMTSRRRVCLVALVLGLAIFPATAAAPGASGIGTSDLKEWLTYIASDELQGRGNYSLGLGLAAAYIQDHLRTWGVKPAGDAGSYLQTVRVLGVRATSHSSITVQVGRETRMFKDGDGVVFPKNVGGRRTLTLDRVELVGYGLEAPSIHQGDYDGKSVQDAAVVWLGGRGPKGFDAERYRTLLAGRNRYATDQQSAAAVMTDQSSSQAARRRPQGRDADSSPAPGAAPAGQAADFTTSERLDKPVPPAVTGSEAFMSFLFSRAPVHYEELKRRADAQEPLPSFRLDGVKITFNIAADYAIVRTQLTENVVGIVEGTDSRLKDTYVAFGAHYDHLGYSEAEVSGGTLRPPRSGRLTPGAVNDRIWNGADDDGSGTIAVMALARAFAGGARPRRSLLFTWHAGEEIGIYGSRYFADHPTVPIDAMVAQLNIDMIGRNRDDKASEANTVYLVGSDRISRELDEVSREADRAMDHPMTLDYELNDPADPEQLYYRSDHYSYAAKGIPVIFFTTGLHPDYHTNTDEVSKIVFDKMARIVELVYQTGVRVANLDHALATDRPRPRAGQGAK